MVRKSLRENFVQQWTTFLCYCDDDDDISKYCYMYEVYIPFINFVCTVGCRWRMRLLLGVSVAEHQLLAGDARAPRAARPRARPEPTAAQ